MKFLVLVFFLVSKAAATSVCSEDLCRACSMIHDSHPFCKKISKSKCCDASLYSNQHSLVPSANEQNFDEQISSVPEIFEEKEGSHFTVADIAAICLSLVLFVILVCKLERVIATIVKKKPTNKFYEKYQRSSSESQEFLI